MADSKISDLTAAAALTGAEDVPIAQSGATVKTTPAALAAYLSGVTRIAQVVCAGSQATVVFSSIPQTYTNLQIIFSGRQSTGAGANLWVLFNADATATNYDTAQVILGYSSTIAAGTAAASTKGAVVGEMAGPDTDANAIAVNNIIIPNYRSTSFYKVANTTYHRFGGTGNAQTVGVAGARWKSTAAITSITFTADAGTYVNGSVATLYGMY